MMFNHCARTEAGDQVDLDVEPGGGGVVLHIHSPTAGNSVSTPAVLSAAVASRLGTDLLRCAAFARLRRKTEADDAPPESPPMESAPLNPVAAQLRVDLAVGELRAALVGLAEAQGKSIDVCTECDGSGEDVLARHAAALKSMGQEEVSSVCETCGGTGRVPAPLPWVVHRIDFETVDVLRPPVLGAGRGWVSVRPVGQSHGGKSYLGWLMGDLATSQSVSLSNDGVLKVGLGARNPAIYVPDLGEIVFGYASWWRRIKSEADLRQITDLDIESVWYLRVLRQMQESAPEEAEAGTAVHVDGT